MSDIVERLHERIGVAHSHYISPDIRLLMDAVDALESLRAENERMREALESAKKPLQIIATNGRTHGPLYSHAMQALHAITDALTPKGE